MPAAAAEGPVDSLAGPAAQAARFREEIQSLAVVEAEEVETMALSDLPEPRVEAVAGMVEMAAVAQLGRAGPLSWAAAHLEAEEAEETAEMEIQALAALSMEVAEPEVKAELQAAAEAQVEPLI